MCVAISSLWIAGTVLSSCRCLASTAWSAFSHVTGFSRQSAACCSCNGAQCVRNVAFDIYISRSIHLYRLTARGVLDQEFWHFTAAWPVVNRRVTASIHRNVVPQGHGAAVGAAVAARADGRGRAAREARSPGQKAKANVDLRLRPPRRAGLG